MRTEASLPQAMRAQICAFLPPKAFLRRDRDAGLFITNAPAFDSAPDTIPGFICFRQDKLMRILPDESWVEACERGEPADSLSQSLLRLRGQATDMENLKLFAEGAKLLDSGGMSETEAFAYDKKLRQRAALALRGGCGGGLYACALLNAQIQTHIKGEETP